MLLEEIYGDFRRPVGRVYAGHYFTPAKSGTGPDSCGGARTVSVPSACTVNYIDHIGVAVCGFRLQVAYCLADQETVSVYYISGQMFNPKIC